MLTIKRFQVNPIQENCYVVSDQTREAVIIDCGACYQDERDAIQQYIENEKLVLVHLLMTHCHFDHIWGNHFIDTTFGVRGECHANDEELYNHLHEQINQCLNIDYVEPIAPLKGFIEDRQIISFGQHNFEVIHTPGHSSGGVEFYCKEENCLFSGDSLFRGSIGRTDFPEGNYNDMIQSLTERILTLPDDTKIYPGHGMSTTVLYERNNNPYLR